jgi:hypothetical protein
MKLKKYEITKVYPIGQDGKRHMVILIDESDYKGGDYIKEPLAILRKDMDEIIKRRVNSVKFDFVTLDIIKMNTLIKKFSVLSLKIPKLDKTTLKNSNIQDALLETSKLLKTYI